MIPFVNWTKKFVNDDSSYGDVARELRRGKCIFIARDKDTTIKYLIQQKMWNDSAIATISEMLDLYYEEAISTAKPQFGTYNRRTKNSYYYPIQVTRWNESKEDEICGYLSE